MMHACIQCRHLKWHMPHFTRFIWYVMSICLVIIVYIVDDPLVGSIARQFNNDRRTHDKIARNWTKRYAQ